MHKHHVDHCTWENVTLAILNDVLWPAQNHLMVLASQKIKIHMTKGYSNTDVVDRHGRKNSAEWPRGLTCCCLQAVIRDTSMRQHGTQLPTDFATAVSDPLLNTYKTIPIVHTAGINFIILKAIGNCIEHFIW